MNDSQSVQNNGTGQWAAHYLGLTCTGITILCILTLTAYVIAKTPAA